MPPTRRRRDDDVDVDRAPSGRRDPRLADELASGVRRRGATPPPERYEDDEDLDDDDQFNTGVHRVDDPDDDLGIGLDASESGAPQTGEMYGLLPGDRMVYKLVTSIPNADGRDRWFTLGTETSIQPDETEDDTLTRLVHFVHDGLTAAVSARDLGEQALRDQRRRRRIPVPQIEDEDTTEEAPRRMPSTRPRTTRRPTQED